MLDFDTRKTVSAAPAVPATADPLTMAGIVRRPLSPAAQNLASQSIAPAWSPIVLAGFVRMIEFTLTVVVGLGVYAAYVIPLEGFEWRYVAAIFGIAVLSLLAFQAADIYQVQAFRGHEKQYFRLASAWSMVFLLVTGITFFAKIGDQFSRVWVGGYYIVGLLVLVGFRRLLFVFVRHWTREGRLDRRTVVVGADERGDTLIRSLDSQRDSDVRVVGVFDDRGDDRSQSAVAGHQKLGTVDDLVEFARRTRIDLVIFSLPISAENRILQMLKKLWVLPVDIRLAAHSNKLRFRPRAYSYIGKVPVLDVLDKPITDWDS